MRVLVLHENKTEREAIAKSLTSRRHYVVSAADAESAAEQLSNAPFDAFVLDWHVPGGPRELVRRAHSCRFASPYVLAVVSKGATVDLPRVVEDGADDFVLRPCSREELVVRAETPTRGGWRSQFGTGPRKARDILDLEAWSGLDAIAAGVLREALGRDFEVVRDAQHATSMGFASQLTLTVPGRGAVVRLSVAVDPMSLATFAHVLLGHTDPSHETLEDVVRELANTTGGAIKRAAQSETEIITMGLPETVPIVVFNKIYPQAQQRFVCRSTDGSVQVSFAVQRHCTVNQRVRAAHLEEGMVVVDDLRNDQGLLLVPAGTRLTSSTASRVAGILGNDVLIEVVPAGTEASVRVA